MCVIWNIIINFYNNVQVTKASRSTCTISATNYSFCIEKQVNVMSYTHHILNTHHSQCSTEQMTTKVHVLIVTDKDERTQKKLNICTW